MPSFSQRSLQRLSTCHVELRALFDAVVADFDCTILEGFRGPEAQEQVFRTGRSKAQWPESKHNQTPARAVDVLPFPVRWPKGQGSDLNRIYFFAGYVKSTAEALGINVRWGGDWDGDTEIDDQTFDDLAHWELL